MSSYLKKYHLWLGLILLICLNIGGVVSHGAEKSLGKPGFSYTAKVRKTILANGLTILVKPTPGNEVVSIKLFLKMGNLYEPVGRVGISTLMQRLLTKGTTTRNAQEISHLIESAGSQLSQGSLNYFGYVGLKTTLAGFAESFPVFTDVILNAAFPEKELAKERQMLLQQIAGIKDHPGSLSYINFLKLFYGNHPYGISLEKLKRSLKRLTRQELVAYYQKVYVPANMVVSVVGNLKPQVIIDKLQESLGRLPAKRFSLKPVVVKQSLKKENQFFYQKKKTEALVMILGYPAPGVLSSEKPTMDLLNWLLGNGSSSRLYVELREKKGLAYVVSSNYQPSRGASYIMAYLATAPHNFPVALKEVVAQFRSLATKKITREELLRAKKAIKGAYLMSHETNGSQSRLLGRYELMGLGYGYDDRYPELIDQVTAQDLRRVAQKYFRHYSLSVAAAEAPRQ